MLLASILLTLQVYCSHISYYTNCQIIVNTRQFTAVAFISAIKRQHEPSETIRSYQEQDVLKITEPERVRHKEYDREAAFLTSPWVIFSFSSPGGRTRWWHLIARVPSGWYKHVWWAGSCKELSDLRRSWLIEMWLIDMCLMQFSPKSCLEFL